MTAAIANPVFTFEEATHSYRDEHGILVPSVTQILKSEGFINFDGIPRAVLERKRRIGTLVHQATHLWENGENLEEFDLPEIVWEYTRGYIAFIKDTGFQPDLVEERSLATFRGMRYGMTPDRRGELNGEHVILELKCSAQDSPVWGLQLAAYDLGLHDGRSQCARYALQLDRGASRGYRLFPYTDSGDYIVWANALANDIWKRNHKVAQYESIPERLM